MKKILITGANGHLGTSIVENLKDRYKLVLIGKEGKAHEDAEKLSTNLLDIRDNQKVEEIVVKEHPEIVIHLAAIIGEMCEKDKKLCKSVNVEATKRLAEICAKSQVEKFIFASTAAVYNQKSLKPVKENECVDPKSYYGKTKLEAEELLEKVASESKMQATVFRIFNIYGPGFDNSLINRIKRATAEGSEIELIDPKNYHRDYIHVDDVVRGFELAIESKGNESYIVYNLASGVGRNIKEIMEKVTKTQVKFNTIKQENIPKFSCADIGKIERKLKFKVTNTFNNYLSDERFEG